MDAWDIAMSAAKVACAEAIVAAHGGPRRSRIRRLYWWRVVTVFRLGRAGRVVVRVRERLL